MSHTRHEAAHNKSDGVAHESQSKIVADSAPVKPEEFSNSKPGSVLVIDIGGTKVKMLVTGHNTPRKAETGRQFTPERLIQLVRSLDPDWKFDAVTIGIPGLVGAGGPKSEPGNLGPGWVGFDFASALNVPVKIVNDAVMQAIGSYDGGRMVFLGLGTGIGSALIAHNLIVALELSLLRFDRKRTINDVLCRAGLARLGKKVWRRCIDEIVPMMLQSFVADHVVLGGGCAKNIKVLPPGARLGHNRAAFRGGMRLWEREPDWTFAASGTDQVGAEFPKAHRASERRSDAAK